MPDYQIFNNDCLDIMRGMDENSIDAIVTDPPYGLEFMGKGWDRGVPGVPFWAEALRVCKPGAFMFAFGGTRTFHRLTVAIEDAGWEIRDCIMWVYGQGFPKGLDIHKQLQKSACSCRMGVGSTQPYTHKGGHDDKKETQPTTKHRVRFVRDTDIPQTKLVRKKRWQILQSGMSEQSTQGDGAKPGKREQGKKESGVERRGYLFQKEGELQEHSLPESAGMGKADGASRWVHNGTSANHGPNGWQVVSKNRSSASQGPQSSEQQPGKLGALAEQFEPQESGMGERCNRCGKPVISGIKEWNGYNVALKPAWEPIIVAMKPTDGTFANNALVWGVAGLNIDGGRVGSEEREMRVAVPGTFKQDYQVSQGYRPENGRGGYAGELKELGSKTVQGRWPANLIHDGSADVLRGFPETGPSSGNRAGGRRLSTNEGYQRPNKTMFQDKSDWQGIADNGGSASRFFYTAKASRNERTHNGKIDNRHPTVKPLALMEYLCTLVKMPGGSKILDPFMGSASTGVAALRVGCDFIGCEMDADSYHTASARLADTLDPFFIPEPLPDAPTITKPAQPIQPTLF